MDNRGQTTFEYLLLVGGVVILAVIVIALMSSGVKSSASEVNSGLHNTVGTVTQKATEAASNIVT